jgi:hypothetical protein
MSQENAGITRRVYQEVSARLALAGELFRVPLRKDDADRGAAEISQSRPQVPARHGRRPGVARSYAATSALHVVAADASTLFVMTAIVMPRVASCQTWLP